MHARTHARTHTHTKPKQTIKQQQQQPTNNSGHFRDAPFWFSLFQIRLSSAQVRAERRPQEGSDANLGPHGQPSPGPPPQRLPPLAFLPGRAAGTLRPRTVLPTLLPVPVPAGPRARVRTRPRDVQRALVPSTRAAESGGRGAAEDGTGPAAEGRGGQRHPPGHGRLPLRWIRQRRGRGRWGERGGGTPPRSDARASLSAPHAVGTVPHSPVHAVVMKAFVEIRIMLYCIVFPSRRRRKLGRTGVAACQAGWAPGVH